MTTTDPALSGLEIGADDRMRLALDGLPVAISWCRLGNGRVEFVNRAFTRMFGLSLSDCHDVLGLISRTFADPEDVSRHVALARELIQGPPAKRLVLPEEELLCRRDDGKEFYASFSGSLIPEANMCLVVFVDITMRKKRERALLTLAERDHLTGLRNRRSIEEALSVATDSDPFGLLVIDLDGFKAINDTFGHQAGDAVLKEFAERLSRSFREDDVVGRVGGDEFVVLLRPAISVDDAEAMIGRLQSTIHQPLLLNHTPLKVSFSGGYAIFPDDASSLIQLFRVADARMYDAKRERRAVSSGS
jgi:diguanylate cyclase (GGDEF)-like protein/PAS domain S-box-containing protein